MKLIKIIVVSAFTLFFSTAYADFTKVYCPKSVSYWEPAYNINGFWQGIASDGTDIESEYTIGNDEDAQAYFFIRVATPKVLACIYLLKYSNGHPDGYTILRSDISHPTK